ncbi:hypothetical protein OSB04_014451 [Centaurea solstitialis]|uniref:B box-type domain-containing protein n=1 Tax=Centaurea solstitialis TaxID=347529 RepID=A0AA38T8B9_9ASTR|nr:hypothetical protein OSB04_014451 [Centaurea solstitialis]
MKKRCELCKSKAMIYCDSDSATLCWSCDAKVHSANFLVARHSRTLLCQMCQSPTPWTASGERIGPTTASICGRCVVEGDSDDDTEERVEGNDSEMGTDSDEIELVDENDDNQVVPPWSSTPPPPPESSSSSSEDLEFSMCGHGGLMKRKRWNVPDLNSEPEVYSKLTIILFAPSAAHPTRWLRIAIGFIGVLWEEIDSSSVNMNRNPAIGDETTSFHSFESTVGKLKRIRHRSPISSNRRSEPASKTAELTVNASDSP